MAEMLGGLREITAPFLLRLGQVGTTQRQVVEGNIEKRVRRNTPLEELLRPLLDLAVFALAQQ